MIEEAAALTGGSFLTEIGKLSALPTSPRKFPLAPHPTFENQRVQRASSSQGVRRKQFPNFEGVGRDGWEFLNFQGSAEGGVEFHCLE